MSVILAHFRVARNAGNGLAPVGLLFQFLNLLRKEGPKKWVFDELANIAQMRFKFAEEEDACEYALRLAADAPYYAPEHLLNGHYLYDQWNPTLVRNILTSRLSSLMNMGMQKTCLEFLNLACEVLLHATMTCAYVLTQCCMLC